MGLLLAWVMVYLMGRGTVSLAPVMGWPMASGMGSLHCIAFISTRFGTRCEFNQLHGIV